MKSLKILAFLVLTLVQFSRSQSSKFSVFPRSQGCRCSSFTFRNIHGELVGDCRTTFRVLNRRARLCYVHQPDNCPDAVESSTFPRMKFSERACFQDDPFIGVRTQNSREGHSMDEIMSIDENLEDGANDLELDERNSQRNMQSFDDDLGLDERDEQVLIETLLLNKVIKPHLKKKVKRFGLNLDSSNSMEDIMESDRQSQTSLLLASLLAKPLAIKHFLAKGALGTMALQASDEILDEDFEDERNPQKIKEKLLLKVLAKDLGVKAVLNHHGDAISSLFEKFHEDDRDDQNIEEIDRESQIVKTKLFLKGLLAKELGAKALHNKKALIKAFSRLTDSELDDDMSQEDINRESQSVKKTKLLLLKPLALQHMWKKFASAIAAGKNLKAEQIKKLIKLIEQVSDDNISITDGNGFLEIKINKNKPSV